MSCVCVEFSPFIFWERERHNAAQRSFQRSTERLRTKSALSTDLAKGGLSSLFFLALTIGQCILRSTDVWPSSDCSCVLVNRAAGNCLLSRNRHWCRGEFHLSIHYPAASLQSPPTQSSRNGERLNIEYVFLSPLNGKTNKSPWLKKKKKKQTFGDKKRENGGIALDGKHCCSCTDGWETTVTAR